MRVTRTDETSLKGGRRLALLVCLTLSPLRNRVMTKRKTPAARSPARSPARAPASNPRLDLQTRRLLQKHYRARHGVK
jgi:hypothetical protein